MFLSGFCSVRKIARSVVHLQQLVASQEFGWNRWKSHEAQRCMQRVPKLPGNGVRATHRGSNPRKKARKAHKEKADPGWSRWVSAGLLPLKASLWDVRLFVVGVLSSHWAVYSHYESSIRGKWFEPSPLINKTRGTFSGAWEMWPFFPARSLSVACLLMWITHARTHTRSLSCHAHWKHLTPPPPRPHAPSLLTVSPSLIGSESLVETARSTLECC